MEVLGPPWGHLGRVLGVLSASWVRLGGSLGNLGRSWAVLGATLGRLQTLPIYIYIYTYSGVSRQLSTSCRGCEPAPSTIR